MEAAQKLDKAVAVLAKKSVEYQERLVSYAARLLLRFALRSPICSIQTDLRKRVPAGYEGIVGQLKDRSVEYERVNSARSTLHTKLAAFGGLPSVNESFIVAPKPSLTSLLDNRITAKPRFRWTKRSERSRDCVARGTSY